MTQPPPDGEGGTPPPPKRRRKWRWLLLALALLVAAPFVVRWILVVRAERRLEEVKANLPFKLVAAKDLPTLWGPEPKLEDNAAPIYDQITDKLKFLLDEYQGPDDPRSAQEIAAVEARAKEFRRLLAVWGILEPDESADDETEEGEQAAEGEESQTKAEEPAKTAPDAELDRLVDEALAEAEAALAESDPDALAADLEEKPSAAPQADEAAEAPAANKKKLAARDVAQARKFLADFAEVFKLRDEAVRRPAYREDKDWSLNLAVPLPNLSGLFELVRLTALQSAVEAQDGHADRAYGLMGSVLVIARHIDQEPILVCCLCASAYRQLVLELLETMIDRYPLRKSEADRLAGLLATNTAPRAQAALATECVMGGGLLDELIDGRMVWQPAGPGILEESHENISALAWALRPSLIQQKARYVERMGRCFRAASLAPAKALAECRAVEALRWAPAQRKPDLLHMDDFLTLACSAPLAMLYADECGGRLAQVAFQLAAYRQARGKYPESLSALPEEGKLPRDPFTATAGPDGKFVEKPFGYRLTPEGFMLWSVGPDGDDDGGKTAEELGCNREDNGDIVLRVPPQATGGEGAKKP